MTSFVVFQHEDEPDARATEKTVFVRDAFSIFALAFPIIWLIWHRLWFAAGFASILFVATSVFVGQNPDYFWVLLVFNILLSLVIATEGSALRMAAFRVAGYKEIAVVEAENLEQAELMWALQQHNSETSIVVKPQLSPPPKHDDDLIFSASGQA